MIDIELMRRELQERRRRAERGAEVRRLLAGRRRSPAGPRWTAAVRSAVGPGVARLRVLEATIGRLPEPLRVALAMCTVGGLTSP